jgi:hypothetical protein
VVIKSIENWRAHLIWTEKPFIIKMDHKNLMYWKEPKKLTGRMARWHENFKITTSKSCTSQGSTIA